MCWTITWFLVSSTISPPKLLQLWGMEISAPKVSVTPQKLGVQNGMDINNKTNKVIT